MDIWKTIIRRIILMVPQVVILSLIVFVVAKFMPGDPFTGLITGDLSAEVIERLREKAGLNLPIWEQYYNWITNALKGDFGISYTFKIPVANLVGERLANTIWLSTLTVILIYLIGIVLGMVAGRWNDTKRDKTIVFYTYVALSIPTFILALVFVLFFGYRLNWFPTSGSVDVSISYGSFEWFVSRIYHMLLPALTAALLSVVGIVHFLRSEIIDSKYQDYVKTARAKGIPESRIYSVHIFRNSIVPIASFLGYSITGVIGGSIFIERIFAYPGMGLLFIQAISSRDYSVITALILLFGLASLIG